MIFFFILSINKNIVQVYNNKNVELFRQDFVYITLENGRYISQFKKNYLVFEAAIANLENYFLFIAFSNFHPMINIGKIKLGEMLSPT